MGAGPSKEELEMYWKSSRQYFDELAGYYKTADPAYYNEFIAPFYDNPFNTVSQGNTGSRSFKAVFVSVFAFVVILFVGIGVFLLSSNNSGDFKKVEKIFESSDDKDKKENTKSPVNNEKNMPDDEFIVGSKYLQEKDYDKAEEHLKKVKKDSDYYEPAQELLKNMNLLRKYDPKK